MICTKICSQRSWYVAEEPQVCPLATFQHPRTQGIPSKTPWLLPGYPRPASGSVAQHDPSGHQICTKSGNERAEHAFFETISELGIQTKTKKIQGELYAIQYLLY